MIVLSDVGRRFGTLWALRNVSLEIADGATVALLGANGSGKSTLLRLMAGLTKPTSGQVRLDGSEPRKCKARIGFLGHEPFLYRYLSATENLRFYADLYGVDRSSVEPLLARLELDSKGPALVHTFSRGETQRLGIARALLHDPDFLLLDEPFTGLDERSCTRLPELLFRSGRTVVMSTHDRARADELATRQLRLEGGRLSPAEAAPA
ncbi:MAG TPA: ABC transporter ATP-binding protein [Actinomycetota bacterium]|nr:ABC transporter ATP-binding protein [Actinomycetota bacterium]